PGPRGGPRRARGRRRHDAPGVAGRQQDRHLHPGQQAVRRHRAARSPGARDAERHDRPLRPRAGCGAGQARGGGRGPGGGGRAATRELNHFNRVRATTLTASLAPGFTLGEALDSLNRIAREVLPRSSSTALAGESRELEESGSSLYFAFILALVVVFMVLASQFESLVHPFTVLLSVPPAVTGALFTLKVMGSTINVYSQIGMILLIGLVTKNSILLVEYINQLRERGMSTLDAAQEAGRIRLRPILMTSVATVMGALPI